MNTEQIETLSEPSNKFESLKNSLDNIAHLSETALECVIDLQSRIRFRGHTDLIQMKYVLKSQGKKIVDDDYQIFWDELQKAGFGVIVHGRHNKPTRFQWYYNLRQIGLNKKEINNMPKVTKIRRKRGSNRRNGAGPVGEITQVSPVRLGRPANRQDRILFIPLRNNLNLTFSVPSDLSKLEADLISSAFSQMAK